MEDQMWDTGRGMPLTTSRRLSTTGAVHLRCIAPIKPQNRRYCDEIKDYIQGCRARFGRYALRCSRARATACVNHFFGINVDGRCGAPPAVS